jgi:predicted ArsR family transcriptional regulator
MKSTRQLILEFLDTRASATALELSQVLMVSPADVRHHLGALRREGFIEPAVAGIPLPAPPVTGSKRSVGRPPQRYRLSSRAKPDRLDRLAEALLEELFGEVPAEEKKTLLDRVAARLAGNSKQSSSLAGRLVGAVHRLNELHYEASWEARPGDPQVRLGRCPYAAILPRYPELCQLDALLLERMAGAPVLQTAKQEPDGRGGRACLFFVGKTK